MAITPINNAIIQRTDDIGMFKHQEDAKPVVDQQNIQVQVEHRQDELTHQVTESNNSDQAKNDADAKDEGKGQYFANQNSGKKGKNSEKTDAVIRKQSRGTIDIKI